MFCHQCGAGIDHPDDRFCSRCGAALDHGEGAVRPTPGPASPPAEAHEDRHRRPISAWPDPGRERIQLPLTELRQRRTREPAEPVPLPPPVRPPSSPPAQLAEPSAPVTAEPSPSMAEPPAIETVDLGGEIEEAASTSRSRAEAALRRMVPPKDEWAVENRPGQADRTGVRDEWPGSSARPEGEAPPPPVAAPAPQPPVPEEAPADDDPIIPWLAPPVAVAEPSRPVPPSREVKPDEGPIIVPRDYDENTGRQRKGRRARRGRGPLLDPAAIGRSIKPSWILAIAGVILLTLIVFAIFPPGGGSTAGTDGVNRFTGMPVHTVATPARPTAGTSVTVATTDTVIATPTSGDAATPTAPSIAPTASRRTSIFGVLPGATTRPPTVTTTGTEATGAGASGTRVVISSAGGWSGTVGEMAGTYTETPVVGSGTQIRTITGPVTMITVNVQKLDQTTDPLEVRVEQDGVLLKRGVTTEPAGIVALSVQI